MTATFRRGGPSTQVGGPRRPGIVYGYPILDPTTGQARTDYVGQSVQPLAARDRQHRGRAPGQDGRTTEQPWADLIVGQPSIIERGMWTAAELDERELFHIRRLTPRYNYVGNLDNPARVPIYAARSQREARDAARGLVSPVWAPQPSGPSAWSRLFASPFGRAAGRAARRAGWTVSAWAVLTLCLGAVGWWAAGRVGVELDPWWALPAAAGMGAAGILAKARPKRRRRRRR